MSMQSMRKQIESLALAQYGQPRKYAFSGLGRVNLRPYTGSNYYFAVPVSEIVRGICAAARTSSVYVTGVTLEADLFHASPVDWFAACVAVPSRELPSIEIEGEACSFPLCSLRLDEKGSAELWDVRNRYVQAVFKAAYSGLARDGSLFDAPLRSGVAPSGTLTLNGSKKGDRHAGRAGSTFSRKGDMTSGLLTDNFIKESFRVWWTVNKKWAVLDSNGEAFGDQHTVLCGVRPRVDEYLTIKEGSVAQPVAYLKDVRVTVHVRQ